MATRLTVVEFRAEVLEAAAHTDVIEPPELRVPVRLWLLALAERAEREQWRTLLGKPVNYAIEAAQAINKAYG